MGPLISNFLTCALLPMFPQSLFVAFFRLVNHLSSFVS